jgi:RHS repeat-associated protein
VTGRISSITLPTGGTISYNYQGFGNNGIICTDGSTAGFARTTPDGTWTYSRSGTSPSYTTTITSPPDPVTGQNNVTVINFNGNYETQRQVYQGAATGTPLEAIITCYNGNTTNCPSATVTAPFNEVSVYRQFNGGSQARVDTFYDTTYSLMQEKDEYDFGASTASRKTTIAYGTYTVSSDSCTALGNGIVDHPCKITVTDGGGNLKSKTGYGYDEVGTSMTSGTPNHVGVSGSRGNLTTITKFVAGSTTLSRTFTYYDTGMPKTAKDVNGNQSTYTYSSLTASCGNAFPTGITLSNTISLSKSMTWNCTGGVTTSSTDENGQTSYVNYTADAYFWRPESAKDPLSNLTNLTYSTLTQSEGYLNFNGTSSTVDVASTLDSLGRPIYRQQKQSQTSSSYDTVQQTYDSFGRPFQVTMPYVGSVATSTNSPTAPNGTPATTTSYDALDRAIKIVNGGGGIVNVTYNQNDVYGELAPVPTVPPAPATENTKRRQMQYDGLGRLTKVCEVTNEPNYSGNCAETTPLTGYYTTYTYDAAPNYNSLTVNQSVQHGTSQTRVYIYDMLGRVTSEANPETSNLAYSYVYDSDSICGTYKGDIVKRVDAKGNVTCYSYDALHRLLSLTYPSGPNHAGTAQKYFVYDSATVNGQTMQYAEGRLAEAYTCTTCPGTKITDLGFGYDKRGGSTDVYQYSTHSGGYYHMVTSYWAHGGVDTLALLNSSGSSLIPTQTYTVEGEGRPSSVSAASGQSPVSSVTYTLSGSSQPLGSLQQITLGSGDKDNYTYDFNTGRVNEYKFTVGTTPSVVKGDLTWNANGSLAKLAITDPFNSTNAQTCTFGYDDLSRIATANCGSVWSQTFSFDPFGNASKSGTGTFEPGWDLTRNWFLPTTYFDSNGNLVADGIYTYSWDAENKLSVVGSVNLTFDALGRMVEQARGSSYTQIVYSPTGSKLALMSGQTLQKAFVALPGGATAVYNSSGLAYYRHSDWLGSSRLATLPTQTNPAVNEVYYDGAYAPYGESYAGYGTSDLGFTGQNQDTVPGLDDFMFREYQPSSSRWIQPDPAGFGAVDLSNPQSWNRYSYVTNFPLRSVDSLGLFRSDNVMTEQEDRDFANSQSYYINGMQVSAAIAGTLIQGTFVNFGSTPFIGANTANNGQSYLYQLVANDQGSGYAYFAASYGTASYELGLPTDLGGSSQGPSAPKDAQAKCSAKIEAAVEKDLKPTSLDNLGPFNIPPMDSSGMRGGAYNVDFFATGVSFGRAGTANAVPGSTCGRFSDGLHIPIPGAPGCPNLNDPTLFTGQMDFLYGEPGFYFTAHIDSGDANTFWGSVKHVFTDVFLGNLGYHHGC